MSLRLYVSSSPPLLPTFFSEKFIEIVEHLSPSCNPLRVIRRRQRDAVDQRPDADRFVATELAVPEIDVVNDLRDSAKRGIVERNAVEQHFKCAFVALMRELGLEHVEPQLAFVRSISLARYEFEASLRVNEAAYQPRAPDPVHVHALPRDPCSAAQRLQSVCLRIGFRFFDHGLILV